MYGKSILHEQDRHRSVRNQRWLIITLPVCVIIHCEKQRIAYRRNIIFKDKRKKRLVVYKMILL